MEDTRESLSIEISKLLEKFIPPEGVGTEKEQTRHNLHRQIFLIMDHAISNNPIPLEPEFDIYELMRIAQEFKGEEIEEKVYKYISDIQRFRKTDLERKSDNENSLNN